MDGKIDVELLWQTLESVIACNDYGRCDECKAHLGINPYADECPKSSYMHFKNAQVVADAIKKHFLDRLPDKTEVPLEEVIDLLKAMS